MHIGIDFDNTIVCYDGVFYSIAVDKGLIPKETLSTKEAVKACLVGQGKEDIWTWLQGVGYGPEIHRAQAFSGVIATIVDFLNQGIPVSIISHKTRFPYLGEPYDLHLYARKWIEKNIEPHLSEEMKKFFSYYFEESLDNKIKRISEAKCSHFVDDLETVLFHQNFPERVKKILFRPDKGIENKLSIPILSSWKNILRESQVFL